MQSLNPFRDRARRLSYRLRQSLEALSRDPAADAIAAHTTSQVISELKYPAEFYNFIYDQLRKVRRNVVTLKSENSGSQQAIRFANFISQIGDREHPIQLPTAVDIGLYADVMRSDQRTFDNMYRLYDVGEHFSLSSSLGTKGRFLSGLVRACRVNTCLEIGTAYGISALFILAAQRQCGIEPCVTTLEGFSPQKEISSNMLKEKYGDAATILHGLKNELIPRIAATSNQFDMLFHDGGHRGDDYLEEFRTLRQALRPDSIVVFDDIRWDEPGSGNRPATPSKRTCYQGWIEVVQERGVKQAIEVDGAIGVLLVE